MTTDLRFIPTRYIHAHKDRCVRAAGWDSYKELTPLIASIMKHGQDTPIVVRRIKQRKTPHRYELVTGFRRLEVCSLLYGVVLCDVRTLTDEEALLFYAREPA